MVGCRPMKRKKNLHRMTMVVVFLLLLRKCYRDMFVACVYNDNVLQVLRAIRLTSVSLCTLDSCLTGFSLRTCSPIWASETSLARTRERAAKPRGAPRSRVFARLASLAQIGELDRRLNGVEQSRYTSETTLLSRFTVYC